MRAQFVPECRLSDLGTVPTWRETTHEPGYEWRHAEVEFDEFIQSKIGFTAGIPVTLDGTLGNSLPHWDQSAQPSWPNVWSFRLNRC